jgi:hypothetical protein
MGLLYRQGLDWALGVVSVMLEVEAGAEAVATVAVTPERSWWAQSSLSPRRPSLPTKSRKNAETTVRRRPSQCLHNDLNPRFNRHSRSTFPPISAGSTKFPAAPALIALRS